MRDPYRQHIGRRVVVQVGEDSIEGTLEDSLKGALRLSGASLLGPHPTPIDGAVLIPHGRLRWIQVAA